MIQIQIQDMYGRWNNYTTTSNYPQSIRQGLLNALKTQLASKTKKARAIDKNGAIIDMQYG